MNTDSVGYPIYRMNEIHDMLCDLDVDKCADITQAEYDRFALKIGMCYLIEPIPLNGSVERAYIIK